MKRFLYVLTMLLLSNSVLAASDCRLEKVQGVDIEMCLTRGDHFQHDLYTLKADKVVIFSLADDFVEKVSLEHTIPDGPTIEFPLSRQGEKIVKISGGCTPVSKDQMEIARVCNFFWGKYPVVKDVRFEFE